MNNAVFGKTMENVRKNGNNELVTTDRKINYLASEPIFHTTKFFTENVWAIEMRKNQILMNKPVYLDWPILDLSKTIMHKFWYDYVKPNYDANTKMLHGQLRYTDSVNVHVKTDHIYQDIAEDVETRFDTSNFGLDRPLPKKNKCN